MIVNSDYQRELKGSKPFQEEEERMIIVNSIKGVDKAVLSIDKDRTVCETIKKIVMDFGININSHLLTVEIKITIRFQKNRFVSNLA